MANNAFGIDLGTNNIKIYNRNDDNIMIEKKIYQANKDLAVNGGYLESYKAGAVLFQCDEKQLRNISKK